MNNSSCSSITGSKLSLQNQQKISAYEIPNRSILTNFGYLKLSLTLSLLARSDHRIITEKRILFQPKLSFRKFRRTLYKFLLQTDSNLLYLSRPLGIINQIFDMQDITIFNIISISHQFDYNSSIGNAATTWAYNNIGKRLGTDLISWKLYNV